MERIAKLLGKTRTPASPSAHSGTCRLWNLPWGRARRQIAATGKGATLDAALRQAMEHGENQARKYRDRRMGSKRLPKEEKVMTAPPVARPKSRAAEPTEGSCGEHGRPRPRRAHPSPYTRFPVRATVVEPHILKSAEAIALKPLTIEEAVKETEFRDRDLLIFHTPAGQMYVLHRRRDGQMELVEIP